MSAADSHAEETAAAVTGPRREILPADPGPALRRERMRGAHLRSRLVPAAAARDRLVGRLSGRAAGHVHGRHVPRQLPAAARSVDARYHPLRVYACLELGIGAAGLLLLWGMPLVNTLYAAVGGGHIVVRALVAALCLLPPTLLMGATLPAIARWVQTTPAGVSWLGVFYAGNIGGRGARQPARRLLPAARLRHGDRDLRGGRPERDRRADRLCGSRAARPIGRAALEPAASRAAAGASRPSTWRLRCRG